MKAVNTWLGQHNNNYLHSSLHNVPLSTIRDSFWKVIIVTKIFSLVHIGVVVGVQLGDCNKGVIVRSQGLKILIFFSWCPFQQIGEHLDFLNGNKC